jgi:hypothetical protein
MTLEKLKIHFFYCVVMLILAMIAIATSRWTGEPGFTQYLANAATITSLVLALVAIFYSFVSNDGLSKSLGNIATVSNDVKESKDQISQFLKQTTLSTEAASTNTSAIEAVSREVGVRLVDLTSTLSAIKEQTNTLNNAVAALPPRLDLLETKVIDATRSWGEKFQSQSPTAPGILRDAEVQRFLRYSSLASNLLTHACVLSEKSGKPLSMQDFTTALGEDYSTLQSWLGGFLSCMDSIGLITYDRQPQARIFKIEYVHETLKATSKSYFVNYINERYESEQSELAKWHERLEKIEALFR